MYTAAPCHVGKYLRAPNIPYGGSFCRKPRGGGKYKRRFESLHHYPIYSQRKRSTLNWLYDEPLSGYEAVKQFGPHTLQLSGLPHGITNQFVEERLRRLFSPFGPILHCHSVPHPQDPFQSSGVGYVSFRSRVGCLNAAQSRIQFNKDFGSRIIHIKNLETDVAQDHQWYLRELHACNEIRSVALQLYELLAQHPSGLNVQWIPRYVFEKRFGGGSVQAAGASVIRVFGSWMELLDCEPLQKMFIVTGRPFPGDANTVVEKAPTEQSERIRNVMVAMVYRGEWVGAWTERSKAAPVCSMLSGAHALEASQERRVESLFKKRKSMKQLKLGEQLLRGDVPDNPYEQMLIAAASATERHQNSEEFMMVPYQPEEVQFLDQAARHMRLRAMFVSRRTLTPDSVESVLRNLYLHARKVCENKRSLAWSPSLSAVPNTVKRDMREFFVKPPLPEAVQIQSRPESVYRRIYDERHLLSLEIENEQRRRKEREEKKQTEHGQ